MIESNDGEDCEHYMEWGTGHNTWSQQTKTLHINYCVQCCAFLHMEKVPSNKNRYTQRRLYVKQLKHISLSPWTYSQQWTQISVKGSQAEQHCLSGRGNRVLNKRKNVVQERLFQFHCPPPPPSTTKLLSWYEVRTACGAKTGYTRKQNVSY